MLPILVYKRGAHRWPGMVAREGRSSAAWSALLIAFSLHANDAVAGPGFERIPERVGPERTFERDFNRGYIPEEQRREFEKRWNEFGKETSSEKAAREAREREEARQQAEYRAKVVDRLFSVAFGLGLSQFALRSDDFVFSPDGVPSLVNFALTEAPRTVFAVTKDGDNLLVTLADQGAAASVNLGPVGSDSIMRLSESEKQLDPRILRVVSAQAHEALKTSDAKLAARLLDNGLKVYDGDEGAVPIWGWKVVARPDVERELTKVENDRLPTGKVRILNLVNDIETRKYLKASELAGSEIEIDKVTIESVDRAMRGAARGVVLAMAHLENGEVVFEDEHVPARKLEDIVRRAGSILVLLGCGSALSGSGYLGSVDSFEVIDHIATAVKKPNLRGFFEALGESHPIQINAMLVKGVGEFAVGERTVVAHTGIVQGDRESQGGGVPAVTVRTSAGRVVAIRVDISRFALKKIGADAGGPDGVLASSAASVAPTSSSDSRTPWLIATAFLALAVAGGGYAYRRSRQ
jgi:hypothetical protein